jgi:hypothetical protein
MKNGFGTVQPNGILLPRDNLFKDSRLKLGRFYFAIYGKTKQKDKRKKNCTHCFNSA